MKWAASLLTAFLTYDKDSFSTFKPLPFSGSFPSFFADKKTFSFSLQFFLGLEDFSATKNTCLYYAHNYSLASLTLTNQYNMSATP